jgi:hypothetical protein
MKKSAAKRSAVHVPPKLMALIKDEITDYEVQDVSQAVVLIQGKATKALDSYLRCICLRVNIAT